MKHILLPALLFIANIASAQLLQNKDLTPLKKDEVFSQLNIKNGKRSATLRNGNELRLDSIVTFKNYNGVDSLATAFTTFYREGDTLVRRIDQNLNQTTGQREDAQQLLLYFDQERRNTFLEYSLPYNGTLSPLYYQFTKYKFPQGAEVDSVLNYQNDFFTSDFYKYSEITNYQYNAAGQETSRDEFNFNAASPSSFFVYRATNEFDADGRRTARLNYSGIDLNSLDFSSQELFEYFGDTVVSEFSSYNQFENLWSTIARSVVVVNNAGYDLKRFIYSWDETLADWKLVQEVEQTFDSEGRITSRRIKPYQATGINTHTYSEYGYILDRQNSHVFNYEIDSLTGNLILLDKQYYYYTEVSDVNSAVLENIDVKISPNPVSDQFQIDAGKTSIEQVEIYNLSGQLIKSVPAAGNTIMSLNRADLSSGTYVVKVITNKGTAVREVILK